MSAYDFNHHEHVNTTNHAGHSVGGGLRNNGTQARYHQVESDYLSRGLNNFSSSTHNLDMSVQLTRPTSKTAMLVRQRRAMLEQLSCYLCKGYLIDATTIDECMDSFCKSCIVIYLRNHNNCPKCGTLIHKTNPLSTIRSDKVLQDIVYKLVPGLYDDEMKRRREFYKAMFGTTTTTSSSDDDDEDGSSSSFTERCSSNLSSEQFGVVSHPKPFYKPTDSIDLSIEPQTRGDSSTIYYDNKRQSIATCFTGNLQHHPPSGGAIFSAVDSQQFKTYLRCPAKLTALQLKKFIAAKFNICKDDTIHLLYLNESLKDEYSLIDIAYIYDWRGIEHMRLFYIIERDLSKMNRLRDYQQLEAGQSCATKTKSRQSVGTSTQTVKRVCIDPHPKYYEEHKSKVVNVSSNTRDGGRYMRSKTNETHSGSSKATTSQAPTQPPILRSYTSGRIVSADRSQGSSSAQSSGVSNGFVSSRELVALGTGQQPATRSQYTNSVTSAVNELSRLKQQDGAQKETRSSPRKITTAVPVDSAPAPLPSHSADTAGSIPKININLNSLNRAHEPIDKVVGQMNTYSRLKMDIDSNNDHATKEVVVPRQQNNIRQMAPYVRQGYPIAASNVVCPTQSSMVTLASFTEARSNHVVSMSTSSAATISGNYHNILGTGARSKLEMKPDVKNIQMPRPPQSTPQLAFSFVTERGITIVRRLNSQDEVAAATAAASAASTRAPSAITPTKANSTLPALPAPAPPISQPSPTQTSSQSVSSGRSSIQFSTGTNQSSSAAGTSGRGQEVTSARHHIKVKPVYKTFVDPTKLKSPNFKKLGYTARH